MTTLANVIFIRLQNNLGFRHYSFIVYFHGVHFTIQRCQSWKGWGCIRAGVVLFQNQFLTGAVLLFERGEFLFKFGVAFARI